MSTENAQPNKSDGAKTAEDTEQEQEPVVDGVTRQEFTELRQRVLELEELIGKAFCDGEGIKNVGAALYDVQNRLEQVEDKNRENYEPQTKIGKVAKLIGENWSSLSCEGSIQTRTRKSRRGNVKSVSINKKVKKLYSDVYGDSCQARTIHQAMQRLGETEEYDYEDEGTHKKLTRRHD